MPVLRGVAAQCCLLRGFSKLTIRVLRERDAKRRDCSEPRTKRSAGTEGIFRRSPRMGTMLCINDIVASRLRMFFCALSVGLVAMLPSPTVRDNLVLRTLLVYDYTFLSKQRRSTSLQFAERWILLL